VFFAEGGHGAACPAGIHETFGPRAAAHSGMVSNGRRARGRTEETAQEVKKEMQMVVMAKLLHAGNVAVTCSPYAYGPQRDARVSPALPVPIVTGTYRPLVSEKMEWSHGETPATSRSDECFK
jgi:hypothetical protein